MRPVFLCILLACVSFTHAKNPIEAPVDRMNRSLDRALQSIIKIQANLDNTPVLRNQMIKEVLEKERYLQETLNILVNEFMLKYISADDPQLSEKLVLIHSMMLNIHKAGSNLDMELIKEIKVQLSQLKKMMTNGRKLSSSKRYYSRKDKNS